MPGPINPFQGKICSKNLFIQQNLPILALFNPSFAKVFCDFPASEGGGTSRAFPLRFFWQNSFRKGRRGREVPTTFFPVRGYPAPPLPPQQKFILPKKFLAEMGFPLDISSYCSREGNYKRTHRIRKEYLYFRNTFLDITRLTNILNKGTLEKSAKELWHKI